MIKYLITGAKRAAIERLGKWAPRLASRLEIISYDDVTDITSLDDGVYILAAVENLKPAPRAVAEAVARELRVRDASRVLNDPENVLERKSYLGLLARQGHNAFTCYPAVDPPKSMRFPVFVRHPKKSGAMSRLAHTRSQLEEVLRDRRVRKYDPAELITIEFVDTKDDQALFRKYGAFRVGDRIIPRHIFFSYDWRVKSATQVTPPLLEEELEYVKTNPHEDWVMEMFALGGVEYGRIDYSCLDGRPQVWEINTNPSPVPAEKKDHPQRMPIHELFLQRFDQALRQLESSDKGAVHSAGT